MCKSFFSIVTAAIQVKQRPCKVCMLLHNYIIVKSALKVTQKKPRWSKEPMLPDHKARGGGGGQLCVLQLPDSQVSTKKGPPTY